MTFLCLSCDTPACEICAGIDHSDHELGDVGDLMTTLADAFEPLNDAKSQVSDLQVELQDIRSREEDVITLVQSQTDSIIDEVLKRRNELVSAVRESAGGIQIDTEMSELGDNLDESLQKGKDMFSEGINNAYQFQVAASVTDTLSKVRSDADEKIGVMIAKLKYATVPKFIPEKDLLVDTLVGKLESVPTQPNAGVAQTGQVNLKFGGTYRRQPCYSLPKATSFVLKRENDTCTEIAFFEKQDKRVDLRMTITECGKLAEWRRHVEKAVDLIVNNESKLVVLCNGQKHGEHFPYIKLYNGNGGYHSSKWLNYLLHVRGKTALSLAQTKSGKYVVICRFHSSNYSIYLLKPDFTMQVGPINLDPKMASFIHGSGLKIRCPESTDLLLIHDNKGEMVTTLSLEVRLGSMGRFGKETYRELEHYFCPTTPILPPLEGHYILDICCEDGKVYLCIKRGLRTQQFSEEGPIEIYEAKYTGDTWLFTSILLVDPTGNPFSELKRDELLHLSAHKGTLMCMVYSPIPLFELKESREPGMYITWYHGRLQ
jgi:hypothetical protein